MVASIPAPGVSSGGGEGAMLGADRGPLQAPVAAGVVGREGKALCSFPGICSASTGSRRCKTRRVVFWGWEDGAGVSAVPSTVQPGAT